MIQIAFIKRRMKTLTDRLENLSYVGSRGDNPQRTIRVIGDDVFDSRGYSRRYNEQHAVIKGAVLHARFPTAR